MLTRRFRPFATQSAQSCRFGMSAFTAALPRRADIADIRDPPSVTSGIRTDAAEWSRASTCAPPFHRESAGTIEGTIHVTKKTVGPFNAFRAVRSPPLAPKLYTYIAVTSIPPIGTAKVGRK